MLNFIISNLQHILLHFILPVENFDVCVCVCVFIKILMFISLGF